jgi:hypothetical protein
MNEQYESKYRRKQQEAAQHQEEVSRYQKIIADAIGTRTAIDRMADTQKQRYDQTNTHERARKWREYGTIAALFLAAGVAAWALCDARIAANQQHKDTLTALSKTDAAIAESRRLADAANKSANLAEASARAWVAPIKFEFAHPTDTKDPLKVRVGILNVGKEPARAFEHYTAVGYIVSPTLPADSWSQLPEWKTNSFLQEPQTMCKRPSDAGQQIVLYPSANFGIKLEIPITTQLPVDDIEQGRTVYFVMGCLIYESVKRIRYSTFCYFANPVNQGSNLAEWSFVPCPIGNDDYTEGDPSSP